MPDALSATGSRTADCELRRGKGVSSDGLPIAYWDWGNRSGIPIVLLHGFSLDHSVWAPVYEQASLLEACRFIVPDLRGHGASGRASTADSYLDGKLWADDMAAVIESSGVRRPTVVAWSYSGRMLFDYIRYYGTGTLAGINLVAAASVADPTAIGPDHLCLEALCSSEPRSAEAAAARFVSDVLRIGPDNASFESIASAVRLVSPEHRLWMRRRVLDYDSVIAALDIPVLVTHGKLDRVVLPALAARLGRLVTHARISIYENSGHAPFLENPQRFGAELLRFASGA
ncbi:alpha/beta fold hydrolase [Paraburkholderia tuberum]|uniref:Pimeloyl-ACP methyl ester carboxylesterase n=1 Tax=Paraburkholderia tuberum TaxID=157910 RepID=A0A1H1KFZ4_9BURK|nr:alpha/beta hydrolase [Paraburkholderia tuberum]SDR61156.1 Pimeloyl-ACP methyl ester carboxylesterase [Paraburkholderia tuberum]